MWIEVTSSARSIGTRAMQNYLDQANQVKQNQEQVQIQQNRERNVEQQKQITKQAVEQTTKPKEIDSTNKNKVWSNIDTYA